MNSYSGSFYQDRSSNVLNVDFIKKTLEFVQAGFNYILLNVSLGRQTLWQFGIYQECLKQSELCFELSSETAPIYFTKKFIK